MALQSASFKGNVRWQAAANNNPAFRAGEQGPDVALLQLALAILEYPLPRTMCWLIPDGIYGVETSAAVRAFQRDQGLVSDGVAGRLTLSKLDELFMGRNQIPQPPYPTYTGRPGAFDFHRDQRQMGFTGMPAARGGSGIIPPSATRSQSVTAPGVPIAFSKPTIVSPPSPDWVVVGRSSYYTVGTNGPDKDLSHNDIASGSRRAPASPFEVLHECYKIGATLPDAALEATWRNSFEHVHGCGATGSQMIDRFMSGAGGSLWHRHGTDISNTAANTKTFETARGIVRQQIQQQLKAQLDSGQIDWRKLAIVVDVPFSTGTKDATVPLRFRAMIGGIHGTKLYARNFRILADPSLDPVPSAVFDLKYELGDHFGVGLDDMYSPDLIAMNILQHERAGHVPFLNMIEIEDLGKTVIIE